MFITIDNNKIFKAYKAYNELFNYYFLVNYYNQKLVRILSDKLSALNPTMKGDPLLLSDNDLVFNLYYNNYINIRNTYIKLSWTRLTNNTNLEFQFLFITSCCLFEYTQLNDGAAVEINLSLYTIYKDLELTYNIKTNKIYPHVDKPNYQGIIYESFNSTYSKIIYKAFINKINELNNCIETN